MPTSPIKPGCMTSAGALLTDLYQLTMGHAYFELGMNDTPRGNALTSMREGIGKSHDGA